jgi:ABC-type amino acid transport substrate-binding protein
MKSGIEKLNKVDVWIEVLDAKEQGVVVDLHIAAQLGLEAGKVDVAAASSDENPIPLKFLTYGTINTSNVTFIDYLASRGAKGNLSSVTITWRGQVKKFPLFEVNK